MESLRLKCSKCGKVKMFYARTVTEFLRKIDRSGWRDMPKKEDILCPKCWKESDHAYEEEK